MEHLPSHFGAIIREWDGTLRRISAQREYDIPLSYEVMGIRMFAITYCDGVRHVVTESHLDSLIVYVFTYQDGVNPTRAPYQDVQ